MVIRMEVKLSRESHGIRYRLRMGKVLWRWMTVEELVDLSSRLNGELGRVLRERGEASPRIVSPRAGR